jgi:16S rRNA (cytosine967-C5)-methyltransferase
MVSSSLPLSAATSNAATLPAKQAQPLWRLLTHCASTVQAVESGHSLTELLDRCPPELKPGVQALSFTVMRKLGMARALLSILVSKQPVPWVKGLLLTTLALADEAIYTPHTLVNQAVQACKREAPAASGFVNAVLRRYLREQAPLQAAIHAQAPAQWNHPAWWIEQLQRDWPEHWRAILAANNQPGPLTLRVNRRRQSVAAYQQLLLNQGLESFAVGEDGLVLAQAVPIGRLPGFETGDVSVQDAHAQLATALILAHGIPAAARVLDACSAPGGKTAHLLERCDAEVLALDIDGVRLQRVNDTLQRLGLQARTQVADAAEPATWWDGQLFDAILLDAPCSASGIVRRHPDVRWLRRPSDLIQLAQTQQTLLQSLWPLLQTNGVLLYCTCSVFKQEGQMVIDAFLQRHPNAQHLDSPGHLLPVVEYPATDLAGRHNGALATAVPAHHSPTGDGFFYALLRKTHLPSV